MRSRSSKLLPLRCLVEMCVCVCVSERDYSQRLSDGCRSHGCQLASQAVTVLLTACFSIAVDLGVCALQCGRSACGRLPVQVVSDMAEGMTSKGTARSFGGVMKQVFQPDRSEWEHYTGKAVESEGTASLLLTAYVPLV